MGVRNPICISLFLFLSLLLSLSGEDNSMRNARRNEVRHMQFDFPVARGIALSRFAWWLSVRARGHILPLDYSHAAHRFSRSIDNLAYARDRSRGDPKLAPTFFATDLCRRRVLRGTAAGGREVGLYAHFTSVFVSLFFFLGRSSRLFCVYLRSVYGTR